MYDAQAAACATNLATDLLELPDPIAEGGDFSGADECEVKGIKEEDNPFAAVIRQRNCLEFSAHDSLSSESRSSLSNRRNAANKSRCCASRHNASRATSSGREHL